MPAFLGTLPQWVSAGAACCGVGVAIYASRAWSRTLTEKRTDDLLNALLDFTGDVGATCDAVAKRVGSDIYGKRVDELYSSLRGLQKAFVVAQRSYSLDPSLLLDLREFVIRTTDQSRMLSGKNVLAAEYDSAQVLYANLFAANKKFSDYLQDVVAKQLLLWPFWPPRASVIFDYVKRFHKNRLHP